jgi:hypothetical protein
VAQLRRELPTIHAHGAQLIVIGNGTDQFAAAFREDLDLDTPLYVDPTCASYRVLGMKRGVARTLGTWSMWVKMVRLIWANLVEGRSRAVLRSWRRSLPALKPGEHGDAWQLGGVLVVLPGGDVPFSYLSASAGDHPPVKDILAVLAAQAHA